MVQIMTSRVCQFPPWVRSGQGWSGNCTARPRTSERVVAIVVPRYIGAVLSYFRVSITIPVRLHGQVSFALALNRGVGPP